MTKLELDLRAIVSRTTPDAARRTKEDEVPARLAPSCAEVELASLEPTVEEGFLMMTTMNTRLEVVTMERSLERTQLLRATLLPIDEGPLGTTTEEPSGDVTRSKS